MATVFDVLARFRADVTDYTRNVDKATTATEHFDRGIQNSGKRSSAMFGMMASRSMMLGTAVVGLAQTAGMMGIRTAQANEQSAIGFKVMLGSAEKAKAFMDDLMEFSAKTPFELPQLRTAASALLSTGVEAKRIIPIMTVLGDATSAKGYGADAIQRAVYALQQMSTAGRATGQDMMQLTQAGIPIWEALAASMGKTIPEIKKLGEQGKISAEDVMAAIESGAGAGLQKVKGMMDEQAGTLTGLMSTFKDTVGQSLGKMMEPAVGSIKEALPGLTSMMDNLLKSIAPTINGVVGSTLKALVDLLPAIEPLIIGFGGLFTSMMAAIAPFIPLVVQQMSSLAPVFASLGQLVTEIANALMPVAMMLFPALAAVVGLVAGLFGALTGFVVENKDAFIVLGGAIGAMWITMQAIAGFGKIITFFKTFSIASKMAAVQTWLFNSALYANPIGLLVAAIVGLIAVVVLMWMKFDWFRLAIKKVWNFIVEAFQKAINLLLGYWEFWINTFISGINLIIKGWNKIPFTKKIKPLDKVNLQLDITGAKVDTIAKGVKKIGDNAESSAAKFRMFEGWGGGGGTNTPTPTPTPTGGDGAGKGNPLQKLIDSINQMAGDKVSKAKSYLEQLKSRADDFAKSIKDAIMSVYSFSSAFGASKQSMDNYQSALNAVAVAEKKVTDALAKRDMSAYTDAVAEYNNAQTELTKATAGKKTFMEALEAQYNQAKDFSVMINRLRAAGLGEAGIAQIVSAGAETGMAIGTELLNGGSDAIGKANTWYTELVSTANTEAEAAKNQFYQAGITQGEALVKGITDAASKLKLKLSSKGVTEAQMKKLKKNFGVDIEFSMGALEDLATPMAKGGIVKATTGGTLALIGEAGRNEAVIPLPRNGGMPGGNSYHIEVNVGVGDKQEIARELVSILQAHEKRTGRLPLRTL
jgi:tape measure domain-containing protein